ncbi:hypothetical protein [Nocardia jiangxiensis]|uniref:hypothetical protein n=1 Tax=Nocardia jiangxiensis TaxID=282685 RepID=UPI0002DF1179|nr:hypothetical protein [Nocardia jiangxiensis]
MAQLKSVEINGFAISFDDDQLLRISYDDWDLYIDVLNPEWPSVTVENPPDKFDFYRKNLDIYGEQRVRRVESK